ncbi:MAG: bifunctional [glutamate--ammonia ligase]-adenylyl-L-tyrosine phosphorylase/[glutamate--ammonia-ligase] adenylyltransferase, partial [Desulfobacteraceae bacterium]|nr:bifunctional [glutamate--ammonia ligase]-adenylyl-L-tyrosine phosphorylase/[glutamate--ammonia-ligase] adenylyltransferase [Desulfobacteraceae bacterium]
MPPLPPDLQTEALARWQAVREAFAREGQAFPELDARHAPLERGLVFSDFIVHQWVRRPALLTELLQGGTLQADDGPLEMRRRLERAWQAQLGQALPGPSGQGTSADGPAKEAVMQVLRVFRQQEMVRIALRDICGWADLRQTLTALSALADLTIGAAVDYLYAREASAWGRPVDAKGNPVRLVVLGLGKLGAHELNFSSDVDLIFAYAAEGQTAGGRQGATGNEAFFTRLCRELIQTIGTPTADGFVFRVDTRLRPYGDAGPLVMIFDRLEDYYQEQGREWERYALIKARVVAGDPAAGDLLLARLRPFVFRRYLDFGAFDSLREMKGRIALEVRGKGMQDNIKLGPGGIREIEFFGQMFQLIRGGVESALQIRPIRQVLQVLVKKRYIPEAVGRAMDEAYVFLRTVENRLQQWADQQTHQLPVEAKARRRLAVAMGFDGWEDFL